jgi:hypothetical protein
MFRHRHRRSSAFSDFINWTDYRWDPSPWPGVAGGPQPWARHARHQRGYGVLQVFLAGLAVVVGLKLISALQNSASALKNSALRNSGNRSWLERRVLAVLLLMVASYVSRQRRPL